MCECIVFHISKCQRRCLSFRYGREDGWAPGMAVKMLELQVWPWWAPVGSTNQPERLWPISRGGAGLEATTAARRTGSCAFHYNQTFLLLLGSVFCKYFLEIETKEMLRKNSKLIVAQREGAICFCLQSIASQETSSLLQGRRPLASLFRSAHESLNHSKFS